MGFGVCCSLGRYLTRFALLEEQVRAVGICPAGVGRDTPAVAAQLLGQPSVNAFGPAAGENHSTGCAAALVGPVESDQVIQQIGVGAITHVSEGAALIPD